MHSIRAAMKITKSFTHYIDVIITTMASQIISLTIVYSTDYSDVDQGKHQSSASLAFVWGSHLDRWIPRTKGQLRGKCFHLMTSSCSLTAYGVVRPRWVSNYYNHRDQAFFPPWWLWWRRSLMMTLGTTFDCDFWCACARDDQSLSLLSWLMRPPPPPPPQINK